MFNLNDRYIVSSGEFVLSGVQAIVKLSLLQKELDKKNGLNTAGYVTGYRGSPLGTVDREFTSQRDLLTKNDITFHPSINEDIAVATLQGTQQLGIVSKATVDGVFGFWYGKGPGVDRSGDQFKHTSFFGTSQHGGCLAFAGDDHSNKSSTIPHETGPTFKTWRIPVITPATVEDVIRLGLMGIAMSRYSGLWSSMKIISNLADAYQTVNIDLDSWAPGIPNNPPVAFDVHARWPDLGVEQEARITEQKLPALQEFMKYNMFDSYNLPKETHLNYSSDNRVGIVAVGKSYVDTLTAMQKLGITTENVGLYKVGIAWPLHEEHLINFCTSYHDILVVEEKSGLVEDQLYKLLYDKQHKCNSNRARVKIHGKNLLPQNLDFDAYEIAKALQEVFDKTGGVWGWGIGKTEDGLHAMDVKLDDSYESVEKREPHFCSGCPHNSSTVLPEGSKALIGIGCHYMTAWMPDRPSVTLMPMGGEGANWIAAQHYQEAEHVFVNLGDGTYFHSGLLAIRASVAADSTITYKILYNDAVAMTGGQPIDGELSVARICEQVMAEGVKDVAVVTLDGYANEILPRGVTLHSKDEYIQLQKSYTKIKGTSVIVFDQQCATEKRRKRKRGLQPLAKEFVWINSAVCENCGDCSTQSNCLSIIPTETKLGTKRQIDYDNCNYSYDCLDGFCPSFATITGRKPELEMIKPVFPELVNYLHPKISKPKRYNILVAGIGGTGVISTSQMMCVASHIDDIKVVSTDQTGLAQKYGAVTSTISFGENAFGRMFPKSCDVVIGIDPQVTAMEDSMRFIGPNTTVILNKSLAANSEIIRNRDWKLELNDIIKVLETQCKEVIVIDASNYAKKITGNAVMVNMLMLGYAYEKCLLPYSEKAMMEAIEANGVAVEQNKNAWTIGRQTATVDGYGAIERSLNPEVKDTFYSAMYHRHELLIKYQNKEYADRYLDIITRAKLKEDFLNSGTHSHFSTEFSEALMRNLYKLMAYKDEYEVARIWSATPEINKYKTINFHMCLPWNRKSQTKTRIGNWAKYVFSVLQHGKKFRGKIYDPLGFTYERRLERKIRDRYISLAEGWIKNFKIDNYSSIERQAKLPDNIRGYGHVKLASIHDCELFKDVT